MPQRNQFAVYAAAALTVGAVGVLFNPRPVTAQNPFPGSAPVNIVNPLPLPVSGSVKISTTSPLPVTGSVGISNLPNPMPVSGDVSISNLPNPMPVSGDVSIANFPNSFPVSGSVEITGTPAVRLVATEPVEWTGFCQTVSNSGCSVPLAETYRVPFGKRLVIEYASFSASSLPAGVSAFAAIATGGAANAGYLIPPSAFVGNGGSVVGGQVVHLYAEGGAFVGINLNRLGVAPLNANPSFYAMSFTGHLE
jgi:hypothetical protein